MEFKFQRAQHPYCRRMMKLFGFDVPKREDFDMDEMDMKDMAEMFYSHREKFTDGLNLQTWFRMLEDCNWLYYDFFSNGLSP